jgi:hypothetical protein
MPAVSHHCPVADIEADAVEDEFPPWLNVMDDAEEWRVYLRARTKWAPVPNSATP